MKRTSILYAGQPLQAACLLYKITGEQKYLDEAYAIAESCHKKWFMPYRSKELNLTFNILAPGHAWFNTSCAADSLNFILLTMTVNISMILRSQ
ncbi:glycoside hydrolase family 76 protein [Bacteroides thetaiotaomicron]|uniref:glycoside hydrolase family 76 protein n=1 Tax=Bacteroides thetaiotaomicron TaxID=818 RepID=UPI000A81017A|nr:glycoside hydrolase family 76 protein [Bacteroides thetaiotaomicron]